MDCVSGERLAAALASRRPELWPSSLRTALAVSRIETERPYLSASEVGNFAYCPEAWFLQRFGHAPDADAVRRLHDGTRRHHRIGHATEQLVGTDALRRSLLIVILVLAALLVAANMGLLNLAGPPW